MESGDSPIQLESQFNISNEETVRRLRLKGQPIRLFAESDKERRLRLRALELIEERGSERHGGQNDFKKALEDVEKVEREMNAKSGASSGTKKGKTLKDEVEQQVNGVLDLELAKTDPDKLYPIIYYALKRTLKEWGEAMDERPGTCYLSLYGSFRLMSFAHRKHQTFHTRQISSCYSSPISGIP
jgi:pre-mRNA-splicing factor 18